MTDIFVYNDFLLIFVTLVVAIFVGKMIGVEDLQPDMLIWAIINIFLYFSGVINGLVFIIAIIAAIGVLMMERRRGEARIETN